LAVVHSGVQVLLGGVPEQLPAPAAALKAYRLPSLELT
jgi:hypothetical protein